MIQIQSQSAGEDVSTFCGQIDMLNGSKQIVVSTSARRERDRSRPRTMANAMNSEGVAAFVQRWKIVVKKAQGPTGDNYFTYDYQFVEPRSEDEAEAENDAGSL